jgi:hypothetical protein
MTLTKTARRLTAGLVLAGILSAPAITQAQIVCSVPCPIWDFGAEVQHLLQLVQQRAMNSVLSEQLKRLTDMSTRITTFVDLAKHSIHLDDTPEWRIHNWFGDAVITAKPYHHSLTYGDPSGAGYDEVTEPRVDGEDALGGLPDDAREYLNRDMATVDLMDSIIIQGTDASGRVRFTSRAETEAIDIAQKDAADGDPEQAATARLGVISGQKLVSLYDGQARLLVKEAILEQLLIPSKIERDDQAVVMNMRLNGLRANGSMDRSLVQDDTLGTWSQP